MTTHRFRPRTRRHRKRLPPRKRRRYTKRQRAVRIYHRLYLAQKQGITVAQLASFERISKNRVYYYLDLIRKTQRTMGIRIQRVNNRLFYVNIQEKETVVVREQPSPTTAAWELHFSLKYKDSPYPVRRIEVDGMILTASRDESTIAKGIAEIQEIVSHRFGKKLASYLTFSTVPANSQSKAYFRYRRLNEGQYHELW